MNLGTVILTTNKNHLDTYVGERDEFAIPVERGIMTCQLKYNTLNNIEDVNFSVSNVEANVVNAKLLNCWNYSTKQDIVLISSDGIEKIDGVAHTPYHYKPSNFPVLACYCLDGYVLTVSCKSYTICNLETLIQKTRPITEIKKCTATIAGWKCKSASEDATFDNLHILICDGNTVYHYYGESSSVIDTGRVLAFCQTDYGFLGAFETNWRLSPLHLFGDGPINIENLELPTQTSNISNEARLQLFNWDMSPIDDKSLPSHNEPTLLIHKQKVVCVSGFYKHVISIFVLNNGTINHLKDISIGLEYRIAGLNFHQSDLLVLKRRFDADNILLTFPSKSGNISGNAFIDVMKLEDFISRMINGPDEEKDSIDKTVKKDPKHSILLPRYIDHTTITEEEIKRRAAEIIDEFSEKPPSIGSFSDSDLSEGTLEVLADCRPRYPFVPIPVSDSSGDELSELKLPGDEDIPFKHNLITVIPQEVPKESETTSELVNSILSDIGRSRRPDEESQLSQINEKLDRVVTLLERQNSLLEMLARQSLIDKQR